MKFDDVAGRATIHVENLRTFLSYWYRPGDIVSLIGMPANGVRKVLSQAIVVDDLMEATPEDIESMTYITTEDKRMNMYISINPLKEDHSVQLYSRGSKNDVRDIYGTFIDFDVSKDGAFESKDEILALLDGMAVQPTLVVDNGENGGIHAYWRIRDEDVSLADEKLLVRWWAYISSLTDKKIDKLIDMTRISRLPSAVYWPKDESQRIDTVRVVRWGGPMHPLKTMMDVSAAPYTVHQEKVSRLKHQKTKLEVDTWEDRVAENLANSTGKSKWGLNSSQINMVLTKIDSYIEDNFTWGDILEPHGWTFLKENSDSSKTWARPGRSERSAVVDYTHDDGRISGVMSLLSSAEETGLADLKEASVPLTKKQVLLRLTFGDDVIAMVDYLFEGMYDVEKLGRSIQ